MNRRQFLQAGSSALAAGALAPFAFSQTTRHATPWRGLHVMTGSDAAARQLIEQLPALADLGVNLLIPEITYCFRYRSHPELGNERGITRETARALASACKTRGVRIAPLFNCLGHQSWSGNTFSLLTKYPELDETPGQYPDNKGIYCRSWCPRHPRVNEIVFPMLDELIDAFDADALHVGMDEVFILCSEFCPRCKGKDPAETFAKAVNDLHGHVVGKRKAVMLMWADRFLDAKATHYGKWEAADNGTAGAIELVPKDIVMCDWHYTKRDAYPSIPLFVEKGFRVLPSGYDKVDATEAIIDFAQSRHSDRVLGHLCTTWGKVRVDQIATWPPVVAGMKKMRS